jgi:polysaccharide export outer membrane protein
MNEKCLIRIKMIAVCLGLIIFLTGNAIAQEGKDYVVGAGDILEVQIWGHDDLSRRVEISKEGAFTFPFIGRVAAAGKSVYSIEQFMASKLGDGYLVSPQVNISIAQYINQKVFLFGEVTRPGSYTIKGRTYLLELVSEAGGFTQNRGSICQIVRPSMAGAKKVPTTPDQAKDSEVIELNLDDLVAGKGNLELAYIRPGDSVYIKTAEDFYVIGEVNRPGKYKWEKGLTVLQAVSTAGGGTPRASLKRINVIRKQEGKELEVRPQLNDALMPNDIVKVPESFF